MLKDDYKIYEEKMNKSIDSAAADFASVRAGRANAAVLDRIVVDYYGTPTPISQMASVAVPDSRTITIQPWDKGGISVVEKAILKSDLGLTPVNDGRIIRINIPENKLDVLVSDEELAARRAKWQPREPKITTGYLARYHELVTSGNRGAVLEAPSQKN